MREVIGELIICSNAGTTRPVPATEVSNVPLSATPVRMDDNLTLGRIIAPTAIIATIIDAAMIATRVQRLRMALCRSSFITLIAALACYGIPSMFGQLGVPRELLSLNPIWDFLAEQPVMIPKLSLGGIEVSYVWVVVVFALVMTVAAFVFGKKIFARHQVS